MRELRTINLVFSLDEDTWSVRSPQLPGLLGVRDNRPELAAAVPDLLAFAGVDPATVTIRNHSEQAITIGDSDVVIRVASDEHADEREQVARRIRAALEVPNERDEILAAPHTSIGEVLFICAVASDPIGRVRDQLQPTGDTAIVALRLADEILWTTHIGVGSRARDWHPVEYYGFTTDATLGEFMRARTFGNQPPRVAVAAA